MDTCWNAEAVLREAAGEDEDGELDDSRLIQDATASPMSASGWRARRSGMRWSRRHGSCVYAAELDPDTDRYCITGVF